jgi:hypothetical protein
VRVCACEELNRRRTAKLMCVCQGATQHTTHNTQGLCKIARQPKLRSPRRSKPITVIVSTASQLGSAHGEIVLFF